MSLEFIGQEEGVNHSGSPVVIRVIGVGGGGSNAVKQMADIKLEALDAVELICANTDVQALNNNPIKKKLQLGKQKTRGMGAGSMPEIGRAAAEEDKESIRNVLNGADMVFIAAGMGGGTGTGAAPVIAEVAKEAGITTLAIVTKPFDFEGERRMRIAEQGIEELRKYVNCLVIIPNDKISDLMDDDVSMDDAFRKVDDVLKNGVLSIANAIQKHGQINIDFADVKTIMEAHGTAILGIGEAEGEGRAENATKKAISSPFLENIDISNATGVLFNVSAKKVSKKDFITVGNVIKSALHRSDALVISGLYQDDGIADDVLRVTLLATGIDGVDNDTFFAVGGKPLEQLQISARESMPSEIAQQVGQTGDAPVSKGLNINIPHLLRRKAK